MQKKTRSFCSIVLVLTMLLSFVPVYADDNADVESNTMLEVTTEKEVPIVEGAPLEDIKGEVEKETPSEEQSENSEADTSSEESEKNIDEEVPSDELEENIDEEIPLVESEENIDGESQIEDTSEESNLDEKNEIPLIELQPADIIETDINTLNDDELSKYLDELSSKELHKALKQLDEEKANNYMMDKYGFSENQVKGKENIINKNGNLFRIVNFKLLPYNSEYKDLSNKNAKKEGLIKLGSGELLDEKSIKSNNGVKSMARSFNLLESVSEPIILFERDEKRDAYSRNYAMSDGTTQIEISNVPVHYIDENNEYKDINLTIKPIDHEMFEVGIVENATRAYFNDYDSINNNVFVRYEKENQNGTSRSIDYIIPEASPNSQSIDTNIMKYNNVYEHVDFEYIVDINRLKENIYVHTPLETYNFKMLIDSSGIDFIVLDDKTIELRDEETDELLWHIAKPYAEDSGFDQLITHDMYYEVSDVVYNGKSVKQLELIVEDESFFDNAVYPVVIDPYAFKDMNNYGMINSDSPSTYWNSSTGYAIVGSPNGSHDTYVGYVDFDLNSITDQANKFCKKAELWLYAAGSLGQNMTTPYTIKRVRESFTNHTWNNRAQVSESNKVIKSLNNGDTKFFFVTDMMNDAFQERFYGFEISGDPNHRTGFYFDNNNKARLNISYEHLVKVEIDRILNANEGKKYINDNSTVFQIFINAKQGADLRTKMYVTPYGELEKPGPDGYVTGLAPLFNLDFTTMPDGPFTIRFETTDGFSSDTKSYQFYLDNNGPVISSLNCTPSATSIDISASAVDQGYPTSSVFYQFILGNNVGTFQSSGSANYTDLIPAKGYNLTLHVKDTNNLVNTQITKIHTLAKTPVFTVGNMMPTSMDITFIEGNGPEAMYQVMMNDQYVQQDGTLSDVASWITVSDNLQTVSGLTGNTDYTIKSKCRNYDSIETSYSADVAVKTSADIPDTISDVRFSIVDDKLNITWDEINNITGYEVSINDVLFTTNTNSYIVENTNLSTKYNVMVRGINAGGPGEWSILQSITPANSADISVESGETYMITVKVDHEIDFSGKTYRLIYDPLNLELDDLCALNTTKDITVGEIPELNINVTKIESGLIEFEVMKTIPDGFTFTGPINVIKLKGLRDIDTNIKLEIE